jgi:hypothetical protein
MAYLDLNEGNPFETTTARDMPAERRLGAQERLVVLLSRKDPLWSLRPRHSQSRLLRFLFGIEAPHRLADPRLEALRRYAVTYRLRDAGTAEAEMDATDLGFTANQLAQMRQLIDGARANRVRPAAAATLRSLLLMLAGLLIFFDLTAWLSPRVDSTLIGFVVAAVALVSFAPLLAQADDRRRQHARIR